MKALTTLILSAIFSCLWSCRTTSKLSHPYIEAMPLQSSIADFAILKVPKADIHLGAEWIKGAGPVSQRATPVDVAEVQSLTSNFFGEENAFNTGLKASILDLLGLDSNYKKAKTYQLVIDNAAVVGVNNPCNLTNPEGGIIIWEGLKVKSVSLLIPKNKIDTVAARLKNLSEAATLMRVQDAGNLQRISIPAFNLYTAYRLARLSNLMTVVCNDIVLERATGLRANSTGIYVKSFTIGKNYTGRLLKASNYITNHYNNENDFLQEQKNLSVWPVNNAGSDCVSILEIQCNKDLVNGTPKKIKVKVGCEASFGQGSTYTSSIATDVAYESYIIPLSSKIEHGKFIRDEIEIDHLLFYPDLQYPEVELSAASPQIVHRKTIQYINSFGDDSVPEW